MRLVLSRRSLVTASLLVASLVLPTACATGPRPTWGDTTLPPTPTMTGDPDIDAVLELLDSPSDAAMTADYSVLRKYGNVTTTAHLAIGPGGRRSVTLGDVRFVTGPEGSATCTPDGCQQGIIAQAASDVGITIEFWAADAAARLRRDAAAKIGPVGVRYTTLADQQIQCVDLPVAGGTAVYCVLESGVLAVLDDGDVRVELTQYSPTSLDAEFQIP
ncbi:MAG: hypothetical protein ACO3AV_04515 [Ilumatobacteraceae bacterium]